MYDRRGLFSYIYEHSTIEDPCRAGIDINAGSRSFRGGPRNLTIIHLCVRMYAVHPEICGSHFMPEKFRVGLGALVDSSKGTATTFEQ